VLEGDMRQVCEQVTHLSVIIERQEARIERQPKRLKSNGSEC
jgi:hypothetical protein